MPTILGPDGSALATNVRVPTGARERMAGLIGKPRLGPRDALVLPAAGQVHTFGMRYAIDVAFCDRDGRVLHLVAAMSPRRMSRWVRGTNVAIEMAAGGLASIRRGDTVRIRGL